LDEVRDADSSRVLRQIQEFLQQFSQNQFVITCRIAAREYTFEQFTEVEIADFDDEQIADFSGKWFRSKNDLIKAERFLEKLKEDEPIRELATNPLLLTLLCLVFEDSGSFPTNRAELYENGVDVLLKKWDVTRNIEREQVYKRLSLKRKEDLLSQIARTTFEAGNYFFKQREVERYITQYIQNLPDASTDPEALELDSAAVLKSIEAHHGLFVERARGIYSFSHLTFHEYFTARKIVASCNPYAADDPTLQMLVRHVTEKRWREVFLLTVGMLVTADILLRLMKTRIDGLLAKDEKLQQFLRWVHQKSCEVEQELNSYQLEKPPVLRVCYFSFGLALNIEPKPDFIDFGMSLFHDIIDFVRQIEPEILGTHSPLSFDEGISKTCFYALNKVCFKPKDNSNYYYIADNLNGELDDLYDQFDLDRCREREKKYFKLENLLHQLQNQLPSRDDMKVYSDWWKYKSKAWAEQLRAVMIEHRNIGHDWQFTNEQKKLLQQYYDANKLLVDCLNSDCYVSREVRQEIEETLLLPITEIVKRSGL
jgi:predicted NACHT family NTPase